MTRLNAATVSVALKTALSKRMSEVDIYLPSKNHPVETKVKDAQAITKKLRTVPIIP